MPAQPEAPAPSLAPSLAPGLTPKAEPDPIPPLSTPEKLSLMWIFLILNFLFCDIFGLYTPAVIQGLYSGELFGMSMTEPFLLGFAVIMSLPIMMVPGARLLPYRVNRAVHLCLAALLIVVQLGSLLTPGNLLHYLYFSAIEIAALGCIGRIAWHWRAEGPAVGQPPAEARARRRLS